MYNIFKTGNTVVIDDGTKKWAFPTGTIWLHTTPGEDASIDVKLAASRKIMLTFNYKDCNLARSTSYDTMQNIMQII